MRAGKSTGPGQATIPAAVVYSVPTFKGLEMVSLLKSYRERLEHKHGWNVPLTCTHCGHEGLPRYDGWTPSTAVRFGDHPTIYANVSCQKCGRTLREEAGIELVRVFSSQPVTRETDACCGAWSAC